MKPSFKGHHHRSQVIGWLLFIASALFFTVSTLKNGDVLGVCGSLLFLVACFVFLGSLTRSRG
ncbi:hypothetical protein XM38_006510 [Halomicronema hongdechloris C2206]|uniref:Cytochrome oxidase subunit III n=1 Tax=Halomicronema hongdechloris C2206 TaxID=1641165 RepID=A0A1Z3HHC9_9CYAN|nr:hypothetical protein XM38_006510 [Halomicronema hongdechloris C2206]